MFNLILPVNGQSANIVSTDGDTLVQSNQDAIQRTSQGLEVDAPSVRKRDAQVAEMSQEHQRMLQSLKESIQSDIIDIHYPTGYFKISIDHLRSTVQFISDYIKKNPNLRFQFLNMLKNALSVYQQGYFHNDYLHFKDRADIQALLAQAWGDRYLVVSSFYSVQKEGFEKVLEEYPYAKSFALDSLLNGQSQEVQINIKELFDALAKFPQIQKLRLMDTHVNDETVGQIAHYLKGNRVITELNLFGNWIHSKGVAYFSEALTVNTTLQHLDLSCNYIEPEGLVHLAKALQVNKTLKSLQLWHNHVYETPERLVLEEAVKGREGFKLSVIN